MAIVTLARQVAAWGDEVGSAVAENLGYKFIKRTDIEKRIVELGFPEDKMPKYDERKPGFFASLTKKRDEYFNLSQYAILEAAEKNNVVIIGRGAFAILKDIPHNISVRLIADEKTRIERLQKEFNWNEKQALQRIQESDENRSGFHTNFYNVDINAPENYSMILNTGKIPVEKCASIISDYVKASINPEYEAEAIKKVSQMVKAQSVVNKILFQCKLKIEFMHAVIEENTVVLYGITHSSAVVEQALQMVKKELPDFEAKSAISLVQDFKTYQ